MDYEDKKAIDAFIEVLNRVGREAFNYLSNELEKDDNEEALAWLIDIK